MTDRPETAPDFADLLESNRVYAETAPVKGFDGVAHAGVAIVTCMDSRIDPLGMVGLRPGDAKIFRNPGGRVDNAALEALVLGVHLLRVDRILVVPHTRCAVASNTAEQLRAQITERSGTDAAWLPLHVIHDQVASLREDIHKIRSHPLIPDRVALGGFLYDVDTGLLTQLV